MLFFKEIFHFKTSVKYVILNEKEINVIIPFLSKSTNLNQYSILLIVVLSSSESINPIQYYQQIPINTKHMKSS